MQQQIKTGLGVALIIILAATVAVLTWKIIKFKQWASIPQNNITIIAPVEGAIWANGEIEKINWSSPSGVKKVNIYIQEVWQERGPAVKMPIVENLENTGQFEWQVSAKPIMTKGVYQITVESTSGENIGISASFKIIDKADTSDLPSKASATEGWQTYRNEEYGFEFKYPKELSTSKSGNGASFYLDEKNVGSPNVVPDISVSVLSGDDALYIQQQLGDWIKSDINVGGNMAVRYDTFNTEIEGVKTQVFINKNDNQVFFGLNNIAYKDSFNQILSTFKFIN